MSFETTPEPTPGPLTQRRRNIANTLIVLSWLCLLTGAGLSVPTYIEGLTDSTPSWDYQFALGYAGGGGVIAILLSLVAWRVDRRTTRLWTSVAALTLLAVTGIAWWLLPEAPRLFDGGIPTIDLRDMFR